MNIKLYYTPYCSYCRSVKVYFQRKGITYKGFDVSKDKKALEEMVKLTGRNCVPIIIINSEVVIGFNKNKIAELLKKYKI